MRITNTHRMLAGVAASAIALASASQALAQEVAASDRGSDKGSDQGLAEIVVTAQKRETKLEKTPMTINVVSGDQVAQMGVVEIKTLAAHVPGLSLDESPGGLSGVSVRGIGTSAGSQVLEQSVGLFVDGIYHPAARQYRDALFDVERVEVVKGSQGVLFGKNTSVGAVSVISRGPGSKTGGYLQGQVEANYGSYSLEGGLDVVPSDTFKVRVSGMYDNQKGYIQNFTKNRKEQAGDRYVVRGVAVWDPTDRLSIRAKAQFSRLDMLGNNFEYLDVYNAAGLLNAGVLGVANYTKYETAGTVGDTVDYQKGQDHSLEIKYDLGGDYTLTATSGYTRFDFVNGFDSDNAPLTLLFSQFNEHFKQFTQEVRVTSPAGREVEFIVGGFYLNSKVRYDYKSFYNGFYGVYFGNVSQRFNQDEDTFAGFGQATWHIADNLQFLAGARLTSDKKNGNYQRALLDDLGHPTGAVATRANTPLYSESVRDTTFDFSGTLSYNPTPSSTLYVSVGQGNKGSGFLNQASLALQHPTVGNGNPGMVLPVERVTTYEAGFKGRVLDGLGYFSIAAYHLDIKDYQDSFYNSAVAAFQVRSLNARSSGVEAEFQYKFSSALTGYANLAWNPEAKLANGERMQRAPDFTSTMGIRYNVALSSDLTLSGFGQWVHSDTMLHQPASAPGNNWSMPHDLLSARVQVTYEPAGLSFYVTGTNLTKEVYRTFSFGSPTGFGQVGALNEPRMITFGIRKDF